MKQILLKSLIISSVLTTASLAEELDSRMYDTGTNKKSSKLFVGIDVSTVNNTDEYTLGSASATNDNKYSDVSVKIGSGIDGGWKYQFRLSSISYDQTPVLGGSSELTEFGIDSIKEFEVYKNTYPFLKFGFGFGTMDVTGYNEDSIAEVEFNLGLGVSYNVIEHISLLAGVDYVYRSWQDITDGVNTLSTTGSATKAYIGMNFSF